MNIVESDKAKAISTKLTSSRGLKVFALYAHQVQAKPIKSNYQIEEQSLELA